MCELTPDKLDRLYEYYKRQDTSLFADWKEGYMQAIVDIKKLMS